jgi:hypothetical protein
MNNMRCINTAALASSRFLARSSGASVPAAVSAGIQVNSASFSTVVFGAQRSQQQALATAPVSQWRGMSVILTGKEAQKALTIDGAAEDEDEDEDDDMVEMFIMGPGGMEWGGPTRGGKHPEPTRYGDWEQKGRCTDF